MNQYTRDPAKIICPPSPDRSSAQQPRNQPDPEMDSIPERLFVSTTLEDLRQQKVRLWVKSLILSVLLGVFAICTAVLAVLYGK